jgi:hypothetical protein
LLDFVNMALCKSESYLKVCYTIIKSLRKLFRLLIIFYLVQIPHFERHLFLIGILATAVRNADKEDLIFCIL